ncbi:hypothetical protein PAXRUDRAFT_16729 [Paxillus rubicundulus Ve08.2h10]|uniref:Uncharacterized protein n=1 Tax=Paxillus rubicundulus Ve08.2h10 TaxID=930991 RepID=A0A0D0DDD3_9AGAM|nr:hypothetical protein PAXRUDRAFT_16729 [Paxillus rubicundulus Ve08.2h10]
MSSSIANDLTKWSDEQLRENEDDGNELFQKKSVEHRYRTKVQKEVERRMAEEVARQKVEVEAQRRVEAEAKAHAEEVVQAQSSASGPLKGKQLKVAAGGTAEVVESVGGLAPCYGCLDAGVACEMRAARSSKARLCDWCRRLQNKCEQPGDVQPSRWRKREEVMSPQTRKKKVQMKIPAAEDDKEDAEDCEAEENRDALAEVLSVMVGEMRNMAVDRRRAAVESHVQMERVLGTLEEIQGGLDLEFAPEELEEGCEEDFEEEEVVEAAEERETLRGWNEEEAEVDESQLKELSKASVQPDTFGVMQTHKDFTSSSTQKLMASEGSTGAQPKSPRATSCMGAGQHGQTDNVIISRPG